MAMNFRVFAEIICEPLSDTASRIGVSSSSPSGSVASSSASARSRAASSSPSASRACSKASRTWVWVSSDETTWVIHSREARSTDNSVPSMPQAVEVGGA